MHGFAGGTYPVVKQLEPTTFAKALAKVEVNPGFPSDLAPALGRDAEVLLREKKIGAIPDWKKALRPEFWAKASASR